MTYTFVSPSLDASRAELDVVADALGRVLASAPLDAIHVPDARPDPRSPRSTFVPKLAPRAFARAMDQRLETSPDWLLDRSVVDHHWAHQERWFRRTIEDEGRRSFVLVGGASREFRYPGVSVVEASRRMRALYGDEVVLAGVAIPTREHEVERLIAKTEAGIELFVTQILGEPDSTRQLLVDYHRACRERGLRPRPLVLSVAPVGQRRDVDFLEAWGVRFDPTWRRRLMSSALGIGWRSLELALELLDDLIALGPSSTPQSTLGINVEHVRPRNLELSGELLRAIADKWS